MNEWRQAFWLLFVLSAVSSLFITIGVLLENIKVIRKEEETQQLQQLKEEEIRKYGWLDNNGEEYEYFNTLDVVNVLLNYSDEIDVILNYGKEFNYCYNSSGEHIPNNIIYYGIGTYNGNSFIPIGTKITDLYNSEHKQLILSQNELLDNFDDDNAIWASYVIRDDDEYVNGELIRKGSGRISCIYFQRVVS